MADRPPSRNVREVYTCDICWRDTLNKSRICARCLLGSRAGDEQDSGEDLPRSDSQYHGENYE